MSVLDQLNDPRDEVRLRAIRRAGTSGEPGIAEALLDIALHDGAEVRIPGGLSESFENLGEEAARVVGRLLRAEIDPRVRAAALDPREDDDRVALLLSCLGPSYEPLRRELAEHEIGRLRLRAFRATQPIKWNAETVERLLGDPTAEVRREALKAPAKFLGDDLCLRLLAQDPDPGVRLVAARNLRFAPKVGSAPFIAAAEQATEPRLRSMLLSCLALRRHDRANAHAIAAFLDSPATIDRRDAALALREVHDSVVANTIARRVTEEPDRYVLSLLMDYRHLVPEHDTLVVFTADRRWIPLWHGRPIAEAADVRPERVVRSLRCIGCGNRHKGEAEVPFAYRDDDHTGCRDDVYTGTLSGVCPICGRTNRAPVTLTVTVSRGDGSAELVWDGPTR